MDIVSKGVRSRMMAAVPQRDSKPELIVRRTLHWLGYRFRLHQKELPGTPDIVLPRHSKVIFVHGCFWHRHGCRRTTTPQSNTDFWIKKFEANRKRDRRVRTSLRSMGWSVLVVWECQTLRESWLTERLLKFMDE